MSAYGIKTDPINAAALGDNSVVAAVAGKRIRVLSMVVVNNVATAQTLQLKSGLAGAASNITGPMALNTAAVPLVYGDGNTDWEGSRIQTKVGEALNFSLSAATAVGGFITYMITD